MRLTLNPAFLLLAFLAFRLSHHRSLCFLDTKVFIRRNFTFLISFSCSHYLDFVANISHLVIYLFLWLQLLSFPRSLCISLAIPTAGSIYLFFKKTLASFLPLSFLCIIFKTYPAILLSFPKPGGLSST